MSHDALEVAKLARDLHNLCCALTDSDRFRLILVVVPVQSRPIPGGTAYRVDGAAMVATDLDAPGATKDVLADIVESGGVDLL